jgi:hypothetical protein
MQKLETERLVRKLAVLDNRTVNDGVVDAWHELVGHLTYRWPSSHCVRPGRT